MKIQALKFKASPAKSEPERTFIDCRSSVDEIRAAHSDSPAAFLIREDDFQKIREFKDIFIVRGRKNIHHGLSKSLLGKNDDKIPLIQGNYESTGRMAGGIRTLLKNALKRGEANLYVIAARKAIFNDMLHRAVLRGHPSKRRGSRALYGGDDEKLTYTLINLFRDRYEEPEGLDGTYIGRSLAAQLIRQQITQACHSDQTVLITGDTGTGKEVIAGAIHDYGKKGKPFVAVNCGAIPPELFEAELFGYVKGAFTGAISNKTGLWQLANDGTLFLDEIADLRTDHQVKILRTLETREVRRIGDTNTIKVNARIMVATNRDLRSAVQCGEFREDLFFRLNGIHIRTSPIRQHPEDIPLLAQFFWKEVTGDKKRSLPADVIAEIAGYTWPGNARELRMHLDKLCSLVDQADHVRPLFQMEGQTEEPGASVKTKGRKETRRMESIRHIRRVSEVINAIESVISNTFLKPRVAKPLFESARATFSQRLNELEILSHQPLLFRSEQTFFDVFHLIGKLMYFHDQMDLSMKDARRYWEKEVNREINSTLSTMRGELGNVSDRS